MKTWRAIYHLAAAAEMVFVIMEPTFADKVAGNQKKHIQDAASDYTLLRNIQYGIVGNIPLLMNMTIKE